MLSTRVFGALSFKASYTMASIVTLRRISADQLSQKMLAERDAAEPSFAIVDVRDDGEPYPFAYYAFYHFFILTIDSF